MLRSFSSALRGCSRKFQTPISCKKLYTSEGEGARERPPKLLVVQPRLRPEKLLQAKLNEALCLANSLEDQRDGYFHTDFFDKPLPPHVLVQNRVPRVDSYFGHGTVDNIKCHVNAAAESKVVLSISCDCYSISKYCEVCNSCVTGWGGCSFCKCDTVWDSAAQSWGKCVLLGLTWFLRHFVALKWWLRFAYMAEGLGETGLGPCWTYHWDFQCPCVYQGSETSGRWSLMCPSSRVEMDWMLCCIVTVCCLASVSAGWTRCSVLQEDQTCSCSWPWWSLHVWCFWRRWSC